MSSDRGIGLSGGGARPQAVSPAAGTVDRLIQELPALSPTERRELASLAGERDAELFWVDLLRLGSKLESRDKLEAAASIYGLASQQAPEALRAKAQARLDAVEGRGGVGARVEFHLRRFSRDAFDYKMILPMMAGSTVYNLAKGAALGRFAAAVRPLWWMRGAPGWLSAASLGYAAEVPTFVLASRAMRLANPAGTEPGLGQEIASAAITLGLLKTSGALSQSLLQKYGGQPSAALRFAAGQGTMFAGLASAHAVEEYLGLRPHVEGATAFTDILASMVSLGIGANLGRRVLGPGHAALSRELQSRIETAGAGLNQLSLPSRKLATEFGPLQLWMSGDSGESKGRRRSIKGDNRQAKRSPRTESNPKLEEQPVDLLTFNGRATAFLENLGKKTNFRGPDASFACSTIEALIEGKGKIPSLEYRWEILEAFEERLKTENGPSYEELRNNIWRKSKDAEVSKEVTFHRPQPVRRVAVGLFDMTLWSAEWAGVRSLAGEMFSRIEANGWSREMKDGSIRRINDVLGEFGPSSSSPEIAKLALVQTEKYSNGDISYSIYRRSLKGIRDHGEVRNHHENPKRVGKQELSAPAEIVNSLTMVLKTFEYFAERNPSWKEAVTQFRGRYEEVPQTDTEGIWKDRLVDLMERVMELAESDNAFTAPKAQRWLESFEASRRGEISWENFEAINPNAPISRPRQATPPPTPVPTPEPTIPDPVPPVSVDAAKIEQLDPVSIEELKIENSIKALSAEVLKGDLAAIEALGAASRSHDVAVWELRDIFEMTWQQEVKAEDFGGLDLIRLREKIGSALRQAGKENPFAKRLLGQLEQVYGFASLIEAPPPVPIAKTLPPPSEPPAPPPAAPVPKIEVAAPPPAPNVKVPKPVLSPMEKLEQTIQRALSGNMRRITSHEVTDQLIKDLAALKPGELVSFAEKVSEHYEKSSAGMDQRELYLYYALGILVCRARSLNFVDPILAGKTAAPAAAKPREFSEFVQGLSRRLVYKPGSQSLFKVKTPDTTGIAGLRRQMKVAVQNEGNEASQVFHLAQALGVHEADRMREELSSSLLFLYRQTVIADRFGLIGHAKDYVMEMGVELTALIGLVVNRMDSVNTASMMKRLGISINDLDKGAFFFQPFPEEYSTVIRIKLPPLDTGAAKHFFEPPKR